MTAFIKKEWMENVRTGRIWILLLLFGLFGVMNPAIAKLTPWMMEVLSDSLESQGLVVTQVTVTALDSWIQFYKNVPMALLIVVLIFSQTFTGEYQKGTLIPVVTKGLARPKIVFAKMLMLLAVWTIGYFLCYAVTYAYNAYYWDNSVVAHPLFASFCYWLFGVWVLTILILFSASVTSNVQVLLGTGAVVFGIYLLGLIPKLSGYVPTKLMEGMKILQGAVKPADYCVSIGTAGVTMVLWIVSAVLCFDRRKL